MDHGSCPVDPDAWIQPVTRWDGLEYFEYVLLYVDNCLFVSAYPRGALIQINKYFLMNPSCLDPPKVCLWGKVSRVILPNGVKAFFYSTSQYLHDAIWGVEEHLAKMGLKLSEKKAGMHLPTNYHLELYMSPELIPNEATYYQSLIRILQWLVELGRIEITSEVSKMSPHVCLPREGHLDRLF